MDNIKENCKDCTVRYISIPCTDGSLSDIESVFMCDDCTKLFHNIKD